MRIETIKLSWFRGAAREAVLDAGCKNVAVYGSNGAGKSTFVDAIEYVMAGELKHLKHEYSGRRQEKGIRNTKTPDGIDSKICITCKEKAKIDVRIEQDGAAYFRSEPEDFSDYIRGWNIEKIILRQNEVANFVNDTKTEKYSVLLPMLGLEGMERAAGNLKKLQKSVRENSELGKKIDRLDALKTEALRYLESLHKKSVLSKLNKIAGYYLKGEMPKDIGPLANKLLKEINSRINLATPEIERHIILKQILEENLMVKFKNMVTTRERVYQQIDILLNKKISVLEEASGFIDELGKEVEELDCPACGRRIKANEFAAHVCKQLKGLTEVRIERENAKKARNILRRALEEIKGKSKEESIIGWLNKSTQKHLKTAIGIIEEIDTSKWGEDCPSVDINKLNKIVPVIVKNIKGAAEMAPPETKKLLNDQRTVEISENVEEIYSLKENILGIEHIIKALQLSESSVRDVIKAKTIKIVGDISRDIKGIWGKLHPDEQIEDVQICIPEDTERAIDISVKFYGLQQLSPRLTLSEGHRNSLGLCVFIALARLDDNKDRPIFLDDIVSSFDREHRGMVAKVLLEDLANRQVLLFTHDREWFQELHLRLPNNEWKFIVLKPWELPEIGLQWSGSVDTFDDARSLVNSNPKEAGNCTRAIMDSYLAIATEYLGIMMPFARGDRNDLRTCINFLERLMPEAKERFKIKSGSSWVKYEEPISHWGKTKGLLIAWGNRASHTGTLAKNEVRELIAVCEKTLNYFRCNCGTYVWSLKQRSGKRMQCECGKIRWKK